MPTPITALVPAAPAPAAPAASAAVISASSAAALPPVSEAVASAHLTHRLDSRWHDLMSAAYSTNFYVELGLIVLAFLFAWISSHLLVQKIETWLKDSPPKFIEPEFISKPLLLLPAFLCLPWLWLAQATAQNLINDTNLIAGVIQLCYAYVLIQCVSLVVKSRPMATFLAALIMVNAFLHVIKVERSVATFLDSIAFDVETYHFSLLHLLHGFVIFVVVFWGAGILSGTLDSYLQRSTKISHTTRHLTVKFFRLSIYFFAIVGTLSAIGIDLTAFAVFSGALGVGIGLGLQKLTSNFVSGVTMLMERSIKIGDLIEISPYTGWVRQLNIRYMLIETSDGREILIPNEDLISSRVTNWTLTTTMASIEIKITVKSGSDAEKARALMLAAAAEHPRCLKEPKPSCWLKEITGTGLLFSLTFWIADVKQGRNEPQSDVLFAVIRKFKDNEIEFAPAA